MPNSRRHCRTTAWLGSPRVSRRGRRRGRNFARAALRLTVGVLLTPLTVGLARAILQSVLALPATRTVLSLDTGVFAFLAGLGVFALAFVFLRRPTRAYILAHELTHALFARLHGARTGDVTVAAEHGHVELSEAHTLTLLAPYFFPFYTVLLLVFLGLAALLLPGADLRVPGLALIGFSWGFHACFTLHSLLRRQTDLERCGYVFSYALIVFLNLAVLATGFVVATPLAASAFLRVWWSASVATAQDFFALFVWVHDRAWSAPGGR